MSSKGITTVDMSTLPANVGAVPKATKKRSALGDISNQPVAVKAAKARKSDATRTASIVTEPVEEDVKVEPEVVLDLPVVTEIVPQRPPIVDIYSSAEAKAYRDIVSDFFSYLKELETHTMVNPNYIEQKQPELTSAMRSILIDWLVEVAEEYKLQEETLFVCTSLIDRTLCKITVARSNVQLLGCACMLLASKYEEVYSPSIEEFVYISDNTYTREQMLAMESAVLNHSGFRLATATARQFLHQYVKAAELTEEQGTLAYYLAELTLQEYTFLVYKPSIIAAACVLYAKIVLGSKTLWTPAMSHYMGYSPSQVWECVRALARIHGNAASNNLHAVRDKYNTPARFHVSKKYAPVGSFALDAAKSMLASVWEDGAACDAVHSGLTQPVPTTTAVPSSQCSVVTVGSNSGSGSTSVDTKRETRSVSTGTVEV